MQHAFTILNAAQRCKLKNMFVERRKIHDCMYLDSPFLKIYRSLPGTVYQAQNGFRLCIKHFPIKQTVTDASIQA